MRLVFTIFLSLLVIAAALVYIKDFGWESFERDFLKTFISFALIAIASGFITDLVREGRG
ncbi:hypothetical protein DRO97_01960 [Archaeoglobales archaeon]|nr:MAG: hypothetical protein DRO97_01960 [Archaeoglobales archaeon]